MIYAGILAGGDINSRTGDDMPRQYMQLGSKAIILHTIEQFVINASVDKIIVAAPDNWLIYTRDLIAKNIVTDKEIQVVGGGNNKYQTIINIASYINQMWKLDEKDICIYHDAIRPFVTQRIISDNINKVGKCQAVSTVVPTVDTILRLGNSNKVEDIPLKKFLYAEQTPQTFRLKVLLNVHEKLGDGWENTMVNACRAFLQQGHEVQVVEGEYSNIKIVTQYDFEVANLLIKDKKHDK